MKPLSFAPLSRCSCRRQASPTQPLGWVCCWVLPPGWLRVLKGQIMLKSFQVISSQRPSVLGSPSTGCICPVSSSERFSRVDSSEGFAIFGNGSRKGWGASDESWLAFGDLQRRQQAPRGSSDRADYWCLLALTIKLWSILVWIDMEGTTGLSQRRRQAYLSIAGICKLHCLFSACPNPSPLKE